MFFELSVLADYQTRRLLFPPLRNQLRFLDPRAWRAMLLEFHVLSTALRWESGVAAVQAIRRYQMSAREYSARFVSPDANRTCSGMDGMKRIL